MRVLILSVVFVFGVVLAVSGLKPQSSEAMPPFARAEGVDCSLCHSQVPELNAYGRYVQSTSYSTLSYDAQKKTSPFWFYYIAQDNSTRGADQYAHSDTFGPLYNFAVDATGFAGPKWTYRVEQQIYSKQASGGTLGPAWIAYNGFFNDNGHLQVGYIRPPGPMYQVNGIDLACQFASRHFAVNSHTYDLTNTRWGAEFNYVKNSVVAELGWFAGSGSTLNYTQFSSGTGTDHMYKYKLAYAPSKGPWEIGTYGVLHGTYILTGTLAATQQVDDYNEWSVYAQRDPTPGIAGISIPGLFAFHEDYRDSNPGLFSVGTPKGFPGYYVTGNNSSAWGFELYEPIGRNHNYWVTLRPETANNGLGTLNHYFNMGFNVAPFAKMPMLHLAMNALMGKYSTNYTNGNGTSTSMNGRPTFDWAIQYYGSFEGAMTHIDRPNREVASSGAPASGADVYASKCAACHQASGAGVPPNFPSLAGNADVTASDASGLIATVKNGKNAMPAFKGQLSDADIAAVLTYIRSSWGNNAAAVTAADVTGK